MGIGVPAGDHAAAGIKIVAVAAQFLPAGTQSTVITEVIAVTVQILPVSKRLVFRIIEGLAIHNGPAVLCRLLPQKEERRKCADCQKQGNYSLYLFLFHGQNLRST